MTNLGVVSIAAAAAGGGATRAASEAAGATRVGSTTISIFMGRSVVGKAERVGERRKQSLSVAVQRDESKQKELD